MNGKMPIILLIGFTAITAVPTKKLCDTCGDLTLDDIAEKLKDLAGVESTRREHLIQAMGIAPAVKTHVNELKELLTSKMRHSHIRN